MPSYGAIAQGRAGEREGAQLNESGGSLLQVATQHGVNQETMRVATVKTGA